MFKIKTKKGTWGETVQVYIVDPQGNTVWRQNISPARTPFGANSKDRRDAVGAANAEANRRLISLNQTKTTAETTEKSDSRIALGDDGLYRTGDGKAFDTFEEAEDHLDAIDAKAEFDEDIVEFEERIKAAGREREELASKIGARKQGQLMSQMQRAILGAGGEQAQVEAILPKIQEQGARTLADYINQSEAKTQSALAGAKQFDIKGDFDLEALGLKRDALTDAMTKFLMGEETDRARIQAQIDMQPEWWEMALQQFAGGLGQSAGRSVGLGA